MSWKKVVALFLLLLLAVAYGTLTYVAVTADDPDHTRKAFAFLIGMLVFPVNTTGWCLFTLFSKDKQ